MTPTPSTPSTLDRSVLAVSAAIEAGTLDPALAAELLTALVAYVGPAEAAKSLGSIKHHP